MTGPAEIDDPLSGRTQDGDVPRVPFAAELLPAHGTPRQQLAGWITQPGEQEPLPARRRTACGRCCSAGRWWNRSTIFLPTEKVPEALTILAEDFVAHGYDLRRLISVIALSDVFQLESRFDRGLAR